MPLLPRYVVPMRQHIGEPARPVVAVGDRVLRGQMIGAAEGYVSTAVHAPTSGRVVAIEACAVPHPSGLFDLAVVIEADGEDQAIEFQPLDWRNSTLPRCATESATWAWPGSAARCFPVTSS
jgi:Na+-translocating ferredoxin:NAD+ oxidoreductase subunit C